MAILNEKQRKQLGSKEYRISHLYKIKDKNSKLIRFKRNRVQQDFNKNKRSRNIILKSRQLGFTTDEAIDTLDDVLFTRNFDALLIAQDLDTAKDIFDNKVHLAWQNYPLKELYTTDMESARKIKFGFGDKTYSSITVDSSGRAGTFHRVHISEFAQVCHKFPAKAKEIIDGTIPSVPMSGRLDIESTAETSDDRFYDMFWEAWEREPKHQTQFKAHFYNWQWDDEQMAQIKEPIKELPVEFISYQKQYNLTDIEITYYYLQWLALNKDWSALKKQYPTTPYEAFEGAGNKLFDAVKLSLQQLRESERVGDWIYYDPYELGHEYGIGGDVSEGIGQASSTVVVWDFTPTKPKVVAIYFNNKIPPDQFAYVLKDGGTKYGMAIIAPERNNHGHTTISKLKEIYPEEYIYKDDKGKYGWETNLVSKPKMMYDLSTGVNNELVEVPSRQIISEARRYDKEELQSMRFDPEATQHFDLLIGAAIGFQMKNERAVNRNEVSVFIPE